MIRNLDGSRVEFLRFHTADYIIVQENGEERILQKRIWKELPDWVEPTIDVQPGLRRV